MGSVSRPGVPFMPDPVPHDRKSWNTPWTNPVFFLIHTQPDPSSVVPTIGEPSGGSLGNVGTPFTFLCLLHVLGTTKD
jgi:hypothetical protein